jgi:hypothetical protein
VYSGGVGDSVKTEEPADAPGSRSETYLFMPNERPAGFYVEFLDPRLVKVRLINEKGENIGWVNIGPKRDDVDLFGRLC